MTAHFAQGERRGKTFSIQVWSHCSTCSKTSVGDVNNAATLAGGAMTSYARTQTSPADLPRPRTCRALVDAGRGTSCTQTVTPCYHGRRRQQKLGVVKPDTLCLASSQTSVCALLSSSGRAANRSLVKSLRSALAKYDDGVAMSHARGWSLLHTWTLCTALLLSE